MRTCSFHPLALCLALLGLMMLPFLGCIATADLPSDTETTVINFSGIVAGRIFNPQELSLAEVHVALVDEQTKEVIDETISDVDGFYILFTDQVGDYTMLAGYEQDNVELMAVESIMLDNDNSNLQYDLQLVALEPPTEPRDLNCWCVQNWWRFGYKCCDYGLYVNCYWRWGNC